jgi:hypothetical protein
MYVNVQLELCTQVYKYIVVNNNNSSPYPMNHDVNQVMSCLIQPKKDPNNDLIFFMDG